MLTFQCRRVFPDEKDILDKIYQLRYRVYVYEREFLSAQQFSEPRERDVYDAQSVHFAAISDDGDVVGTLRLILPDGRTLPIEEKVCALPADRSDYAEVSRLIVSNNALNQCLRPAGGSMQDVGPERMVSKMQAMTFHMCKAAVAYSVSEGIHRWYAFMEKGLWRLLVNHGLRFHSIGPMVDHFGQVIPFMADVDTFHGPIAAYQQRHEPAGVSIPELFSPSELVLA